VNIVLESTLKEHAERMTSQHFQLAELRYQIKEDKDIEKAEEFFYTNKTILKAAYR
jgi:hypothetical protein